MRRAIAAEWGKVWALRSAWFGIPAAVLVTLVVAATLANDFTYDIAQHHRPATDTTPVLGPLLPAVQVGQLALVALAALVVTSEYATGVVRATFLARPRRGDVLLAKTVVATSIGAAGGLAAAAVGWWASAFVLGPHAVAGSPVAGCLRVTVVVALACAFTVAVGSLLRGAAATLTAAFVMLVGLDVLSQRVGAYTPAGAAAAFASGDATSYPSRAGLLVLAAWVVAAQAAAWVLLRRRDA